ncbi:MAG: hypothetical protein JNM80_08885 [Phycisphaerae bacterium]|nr:hypothetical protein [Phycisphaerae bacterium]
MRISLAIGSTHTAKDLRHSHAAQLRAEGYVTVGHSRTWTHPRLSSR